jgi:hypothetical protein
MQKITRETITGAYGNHKKLFEKGGWSFKDTLDTIEKGIAGKFLEEVQFISSSKSDIENIFTISFDWDKYKVNYSDENNIYEMDSNKSISEQISELIPILSKFIDKTISKQEIKSIQVLYSYPSRVYNNEDLLSEARKALKTTPLKKEESSKINAFSNNNFSIEVQVDALSEVNFHFITKVGKN